MWYCTYNTLPCRSAVCSVQCKVDTSAIQPTRIRSTLITIVINSTRYRSTFLPFYSHTHLSLSFAPTLTPVPTPRPRSLAKFHPISSPIHTHPLPSPSSLPSCPPLGACTNRHHTPNSTQTMLACAMHLGHGGLGRTFLTICLQSLANAIWVWYNVHFDCP